MPKSNKQIVVIQSGWVFIGITESLPNGDTMIRGAQNIRKWGTTKGLGQIALDGMPKDAICDLYGTIRVPASQILFSIECKV